MIPKIIHYCWFGPNGKGKRIEQYISTWRKYMPDYTLMEWNEGNFPINYNKYTEEAYKAGKYAFVSDVARLCALSAYGGVYFDTDIEVFKPLDPYLGNDLVAAFESKKRIMTGFFAVSEKNRIIDEFLECYKGRCFYCDNGGTDTMANTVLFTQLLITHGLELNGEKQTPDTGMQIYGCETFGAMDTDAMSICKTPETVLAHHCNASWCTGKQRLIFGVKKKVSGIIGRKAYLALKRRIKRLWV